MNKPGCLSILARRAPRRAAASWKPCIVFLSCARARFLWRCRVKRWPPASCKSHGDGPCHEPWGLTASHWTTSVAPTLSAFKSPPCAFEAHVFLFSLPPFNSLILLFCSHFSPFFYILLFATSCLSSSSMFPSVHTSFPLCIPSSLLPLSHCPGQERVCQAFPVQAAGPDHTLWGDFCNYCQRCPIETRSSYLHIYMELLYTLYGCFWQ